MTALVALSACSKFPGHLINAPSRPETNDMASPVELLLMGNSSQSTGQCAVLTANTADRSGNTLGSILPVSVSLNATGSAQFFQDTVCTQGISSVTIPEGASTATFYMTDSSVETVTITATDTSAVLGQGTLLVNISAGAVLSISNGPNFSFGSLAVGSQSSQTFTVTNTGPISATSISGVSLSAPFSFTGGSYPGTGGNCASALAPAATCTISLTFAPLSTGSYNTTAGLSYNGGTGTQASDIVISGTGAGVAKQVSITGPSTPTAAVCAPYVLTSEDQSGHQTSVTSATALTLSGVGAGSFYSDSQCSNPTTSGQIASGASTATVFFLDNNAETVTLSASGSLSTGTLQITVLARALLVLSDGPTYNFGTLVLGNSATKTFTLTNTGGVPAINMGATIPPTPFSFVGGSYPGGGNCGVSLGVGASCTVVFQFAPTSEASYNTNVTILYFDGAAVNTSLLPVTGIGVIPTQPFHVSRLFNQPVRTIAMAPNGSDLYLGGAFRTFNSSPAPGIIKLTSSWTVDTTFNPGSGASGNCPTTLGVNWITPVNDGTGRYYVVGCFTLYNGTATSGIVRINSDGSIDTAFNPGTGFTGGIASPNLAAVAPTTGGSHQVYVLGSYTTYNGTAVQSLVRLNADGSLDTAFNSALSASGGFTIPNPYSVSLNYFALTPGVSPQIYVAGHFISYNGNTVGDLIRLNNDASLDTSFNFSCYNPSNLNGTGGNSVSIVALAPDTSGDIYMSGCNWINGSNITSTIMRIQASGAINNTFDSSQGGVAPTGFFGAPDGSGDVYVTNMTSWNNSSVPRIVRLTATGAINTSFALGSAPNAGVNIAAVATDGSGTVYIGGPFTQYNLQPYNYVLKLGSNGTPDPAVQTGVGVSYGNAGNAGITALLPLTDGFERILVAGGFNYYGVNGAVGVLKLNPDATWDSTFSFGSGFNLPNSATAMVFVPGGSGDVYMGGGFTSYNGTNVNHLMRVTSAGAINNSFQIGAGFNNTVYAVLPQPGGTGVYVGGLYTQCQNQAQNYIVRLTSTGAVDTAFNVGTGFNGQVNTIVAANDGTNDIYVGGAFTRYNGILVNDLVRLTASGAISSTFTASAFGGPVNVILMATDGSNRLYVGGAFSTYNGVSHNNLVRLSPSGAADTSFNIGTGFTGGGGTNVKALLFAPDGSGDLYIAGNFTAFNGSAQARLARLTSSGTANAILNIGAGFPAQVNVLAAAQDGTNDIFVGGNSNYYNNTTTDYLVRLHATGVLY